MDWLANTRCAALVALTSAGVVLSIGTVWVSPAKAAQGQLRYTCRFDNGPRAGQILTYTDVAGPPIAIGVGCSDGQGSTGSVVPDGSVQAPAPVQPPYAPRRQDMTFICRFDDGPRSGQTQSYAGVTGIQPMQVGAPCTDGQGSAGVAIAEAAPPAPATSFSCQFDNGPRTGQTQSYAGVTGIRPMQVGGLCTDGQGSTGFTVPDTPILPPASVAAPPTLPAAPPAPGPETPSTPPPETLPTLDSPAPPHSDEVPGAAIGAPVRGLYGAKWADPSNSGFVSGYSYKGRYHRGAPPGYDPTTATVVSQSADAAVAVSPAPGIPNGAIVGSPVRGEPGAVWADLNNDGVADGYVEHGRYFPGVPPGFTAGSDSIPVPFAPPPVTRSGERG